jgi:hypothetical protein
LLAWIVAARAVTGLIQDDPQINLKDMTAIQTDNQSLAALEIIPYLKGLAFDDPRVAAARTRLVEWDVGIWLSKARKRRSTPCSGPS